MAERRVIAINLDAFDAAYARDLMADGKLEGLARLAGQSAEFDLSHGEDNGDRDTGRTGEHIATGLKPESTGAWAPFKFRADDYSVVQQFTPETPYLAQLDARCVVMDPTYFDLSACPDVRGLVGWSGHDPGAHDFCRPDGLDAEIAKRFGGPAMEREDLHRNVYRDASAVKDFAGRMVANVHKRMEIFAWMLDERFTDWEFGLLSVEETHDTIEHLAFGILPDHPYAGLPTCEAARAGMEQVYEAVSDGVAMLMDRFEDAVFVVFTMHGMGINRNDTPSMILLPELLYRDSFGRSLFQSPPHWAREDYPVLGDDENWFSTIIGQLRPPLSERLRRIPNKLSRMATWRPGAEPEPFTGRLRDENEIPVSWLPGVHYRRYWPRMSAFALPSLHNGSIRINLKGRERSGRVATEDYEAEIRRIQTLLGEYRNAATGEPAVVRTRRASSTDPMALNAYEPDLWVHWSEKLFAIEHPEHGRIGPVPHWRTGGHTGKGGILYVARSPLPAGPHAPRSSYDVVPTIIDLLTGQRLNRIDGTSVLEGISPHRATARVSA